MGRLKSVVIGLGRQSIEDHIPGLKDSQFAQLEAICDINEDKIKEWQDKLEVRGYRDYRKLFNSEELDFIIATTPHDIYKGITVTDSVKQVLDSFWRI